MMETILSWVLSAVGEGLEAMMDYLFGLLKLSLSSIIGYFPFLVGAYQVLQACALGLILAIGGWNLVKFFGGKLANVQDTPIQILIRGGIAAMLVFSGGYILTMIVDIAKQPYDAFRAMDAVEYNFKFAIGASDFAALGVGPAATLLIALIFTILIAWNLIKLFVEIAERYLLVGVLAYTSPIFYPFLCSTSMSQVFSKWIGMFVGQCAMMTVSILFTNLICSVFSVTGADTDAILKLLFGLAMCKVAQRADAYLQQLGIGVATTGGNLMGDIVSLGLMASRGLRDNFVGHGGGDGGSGGGNSRKTVLGSKTGGLGGIAGFAAGSYKAYKDGATGADIFKQGAKAAHANGVGPLNPMRYIRNAQQARRENIARASVENETKFNERSKYWNDQHKRSSTTGGAVSTSNYSDLAKGAGMTDQQYWRTMYKMNGAGSAVAAPPGDGKGQSGDFVLDNASQAAGMMVSEVNYRGKGANTGKPLEGATMLTGPDQVVAAHIRNNYQKAQTGIADAEGYVDEEATKSYQDAMVNTVQYGAPIVAEDVLFGGDKTLQGNDALGQAAIKAAFGDKVVPESVGGLRDIKAETSPVVKNSDGQIISGGGRTITATYEAPVYDESGAVQRVAEDGMIKKKTATHQMVIMDDVAYSQMDQSEQWKMEAIQSESGGTYYVRRAEVSQYDAVQENSAGPAAERSARGTQGGDRQQSQSSPFGKRPNKRTFRRQKHDDAE